MNFREWLNVQEAGATAATAFARNQGILRNITTAPGPTADFSRVASPLDPADLAKRGYAGVVGGVGGAFKQSLYSDPSARPVPVSNFFPSANSIKDAGEWVEATATVPAESVGSPQAIEALKKQMMQDPKIQELIQAGEIDPKFLSNPQLEVVPGSQVGNNVTVKLRLKKLSGRTSQWINQAPQVTGATAVDQEEEETAA